MLFIVKEYITLRITMGAGVGGGGEPYEASTTSTSAYCILTLFS